jgi:hypothetical protein
VTFVKIQDSGEIRGVRRRERERGGKTRVWERAIRIRGKSKRVGCSMGPFELSSFVWTVSW